jgi:predicted nucleic acid-binding protein
VLLPAAHFAERLLSWAVRLNVSGRRIYDLQIALTALDNGAEEIWTHDRQFVTVPGLLVRDPLS